MISLAKPFFDEKEKEAVARVLDSGWIMQGKHVADFETSIAGQSGSRYCIAVTSGTAALHICFLALGINQGDGIIIPSFAWPSAANITHLLGAKPIFLDSKTSDYNLKIDQLEKIIEQSISDGIRVKAILPVHQFGAPCEISRVLEIAAKHNLKVIEDSACALGTRINGQQAGTFGLAGIFSFHPRKIITTGEGGAIITDSIEFAEKCRALKNHGNLRSAGLNYRMTDIQAAIGLVQLSKLKSILSKRKYIIETYLDILEGQDGITLPEYLSNSEYSAIAIQTLMVLLDKDIDRDKIIKRMAEFKIETNTGAPAAHQLPIFANSPDTCPSATELHQQGLALPLHAAMTKEEARKVAETLIDLISPETYKEPQTLELETCLAE